MKVQEKFRNNHDGTFTIQNTYLNQPYLEIADQYRAAGVGMTGESRLVGVIPMHIMQEWFKEAGVSWDDREACKEIVKRKMLSGDFDKLRVWEGSY